jgi:hypothetical protein
MSQYVFKIHFNIIFPSTPKSSRPFHLGLPNRISYKFLIRATFPAHVITESELISFIHTPC